MKIMAFDSSAKTASVAICDESRILSEFNVNNGLTHSQTLMPMAQQALELAKLEISCIDAFAVSIGPGSFTGLRIGIAAVKGLAQALSKPCVGVSTLEALIRNLTGLDGIGCAVMDARREQVYNCIYRLGDSPKRLCEDRAVPIEELAEGLQKFSQKIFLVGDGADLCYNELEYLSNINKAPIGLEHQRATSVAACAFDKLKNGGAIDAAELMPRYLRLSQAERQRKIKKPRRRGSNDSFGK